MLTGYMKIPDIDGESKTAGHEDEIDVHGLDWEIEREAGSVRLPGRARGRVEVSPVEIMKFYDASSPYLAKAVEQGKVFGEIVLTFRKDSGDVPLDYLILTLQNAVFTGYRMFNDGPEEELLQIREDLEISFESMTIKYTVPGEDGRAGAEHEVEIDPNRTT